MLETDYYAEGIGKKSDEYCKALYIAILGYDHYKLRVNVSIARVRLALGFVFGFEYTKAIWLQACGILANYKKKNV